MVEIVKILYDERNKVGWIYVNIVISDIRMKGVLLMRKYVVILWVILLLLTFPLGNAMAAQAITVTLNGERLNFDVSPELESGRVLVPLRAIFEALDANVEWDGTTGTVTVIRGSDTVKLTVGEKTAYKSGAPVELDVPAKVVNGRTLGPVRFVSETLGAEVDWDAQGRVVRINQRKDLANAYSLVLDTLLSLDHGWDKDMKYISVEVKSLHGFTDTYIPVIVENLKKHKVTVIQLPLDELVKQGLADQKGVLDGILLQIQEATLTADNKLTVSGKAIKSAKQSIGTTIELQKKNGVWEVSNITITNES